MDSSWTFIFYGGDKSGNITPVNHTYVFSSMDESTERPKDELLSKITRYASRLSAAYPLLASPSSIEIYPLDDQALISPVSLSLPCGTYNVKFTK